MPAVGGGRFHPDFVAKLKDGRALVVEYMGAQLVADSNERRAVGLLWERTGPDTNLFRVR